MSNEIPEDWKGRLYVHYVSSGQANATETTARSNFTVRAAYIRSLIGRHIPLDRKARIVDLGCGHGTFLYFLKEAGYRNIAGVDISQEQIELAHQLGILEAQIGEVIPFLEESEPASIDAFLLIDVIEHLTNNDMFRTLDLVYRALRPGGRCIVHVPNGEGLFGMGVRYGDLTHENAFSTMSARQLFSTIGFRDIHTFEDKPIVHGAKSLIRRIIWDFSTFFLRALYMAETGSSNVILSRNMVITAIKSGDPAKGVRADAG